MQIIMIAALAAMFAQPAPAGPENIARKATVTASSEYDHAPARLLARQAIDGQIPELLDKDDWDKSWAVDGATWANRVTFDLEWDEPVRVAEIIYYGRVSWLIGECFRRCEVRLDDQPEPVATRFFEMNAGPQRIPIEPATVSKISLTFIEAYQASNPGAAEIEVYSESPADEDLPELKRMPKNWALEAEVSATSEYSDQYLARFAADGKIPAAFSAQDVAQAWAKVHSERLWVAVSHAIIAAHGARALRERDVCRDASFWTPTRASTTRWRSVSRCGPPRSTSRASRRSAATSTWSTPRRTYCARWTSSLRLNAHQPRAEPTGRWPASPSMPTRCTEVMVWAGRTP